MQDFKNRLTTTKPIRKVKRLGGTSSSTSILHTFPPTGRKCTPRAPLGLRGLRPIKMFSEKLFCMGNLKDRLTGTKTSWIHLPGNPRAPLQPPHTKGHPPGTPRAPLGLPRKDDPPGYISQSLINFLYRGNVFKCVYNLNFRF